MENFHEQTMQTKYFVLTDELTLKDFYDWAWNFFTDERTEEEKIFQKLEKS